MTATLKVRHEAGFGIELRRGRFEVHLDGATVGSLEHHAAVETQIDPGPHALQIRKGRYSSRIQHFDASDGEVVSFRCHGTRIWPAYLASILKTDLAISLKRD